MPGDPKQEGWDKVLYAAQTTTVRTVFTGLGKLGGYHFYNPHSAAVYVQVFDVATGTTVTLGTTVPDLAFALPATSGAVVNIADGAKFSLGCKLAVTTTATGSTAPATGADLNVFYKASTS